jgi:cytochrome c oxidase subunit 4
MSNEQVSHHIVPLRVYLRVGAALLFLTAVTVAVSRFDFGEFNLIVAMSIAALKGMLVVLIFMHLKYDNKFYMIIFTTALIFLSVFIILTMMDTQTRGDIYDYEMQPIQKNAVIYNQPFKEHEADTIATPGQPQPSSTSADTASFQP